MDKVVHFEVPTDDLDRAKAFYAAAFDWDLRTTAMEQMTYTSVITTASDGETGMPTEPGAINGGMTGRSAETPAPVITIGVASIDDATKKIEAGGGTIVTPRTPIPGMGAFAYFKDTEGNILGLWETA
jgi:predicted enzyme related to lactoylglutathione lyase